MFQTTKYLLKFKSIQVTQSVFSNHNGNKLEINKVVVHLKSNKWNYSYYATIQVKIFWGFRGKRPLISHPSKEKKSCWSTYKWPT